MLLKTKMEKKEEEGDSGRSRSMCLSKATDD